MDMVSMGWMVSLDVLNSSFSPHKRHNKNNRIQTLLTVLLTGKLLLR